MSKIFSIKGQGLKLHSADDAKSHIDTLKAIQGLEEVQLGGNTLGVGACAAFGEALRGNQTLKIADLSDIFTGRLITEIPQALSSLCDSLITYPIVPFITQHPSFSTLRLANNGLGVTGGVIIAEALQRAVTPNLKTVICGRNRLENGSAPEWAKAFKVHKGLEEIRLYQNGIRMQGVEAIFDGLKSCPGLRILDIQDNTISEKGSEPRGCRAIASALPSWPQLRELNLSDCLLKPDGGLVLATAFSKGHNPEMEVLKLAYGEFDHRTIDLIALSIKEFWPNLTRVELNGNIGDAEDECIQNVRDALEAYGREDALDELDDMMDPAEFEEEEAEEHPAVETAEELDRQEAEETKKKETPSIATTLKETVHDAADDLADLMNKVSLGEKPAQA